MTASAWPKRHRDDPHPLANPPGCVLTVLKGHDVIVWLIGELDANVAPDLAQIAEQIPDVASRLIVDGSRVTFSDSTVMRFIAAAATAVPVTIRRPSRIFAQIIAFSGLAMNPWVQIDPDESS